MIDLTTLYTQVAACSTLNDSMRALLTGAGGLLELLDSYSAADVATALRALTKHPDDANQQIAWVDLLREALTRGTSHVAVHPDDPLVDIIRSSLEMPTKDKAARVALVKAAVSDDQAVAATVTEMDALRADIATKTAEHEAEVAAHADTKAELAKAVMS